MLPGKLIPGLPRASPPVPHISGMPAPLTCGFDRRDGRGRCNCRGGISFRVLRPVAGLVSQRNLTVLYTAIDSFCRVCSGMPQQQIEIRNHQNGSFQLILHRAGSDSLPIHRPHSEIIPGTMSWIWRYINCATAAGAMSSAMSPFCVISLARLTV